MFKTTGKSGLRRSSGGGSGTPRVSGLTQLRGTTPPHLMRPPFLPDTPQEQTFDSNTPRVDETA